MESYFQRLKRGWRAARGSFGPGGFSAGGKKIACPHCAHEVFSERPALLNTRVLTFLDLDWADKRATTLICSRCGQVLWFQKKPDRTGAGKDGN